ncbi:site-specific integrase [Burkholderia vietnamiensis]|uniref:site-specific integrase n=1 Tax=Burkholderia vietnamiensis TaxID=60552 RepID=UPI00084191DD|nr:site-specific integrase [Burkholderia vietnamiensis]AOK41833.1 integrase [Burkholderia vietnamiensis]
MASITKRGRFWRAQIIRKGYPPQYRTFDTQAEAEAWARLYESEMDRGVFQSRTEAERTTLAEALDRYWREIASLKRHPRQERYRIDHWLRQPERHYSLANLRGTDFAQYRDRRRAAGRAENTIRLELAIVSHLFETARKEWGMEGLANPLKNIKKPSGSRERDRRLRAGEYEQISAGLAACGNPWARPAFDLALETALRQGALFMLRWEWVFLDRRMIAIPAAFRGTGNKAVPAVLPLSQKAIFVLNGLPRSIDGRVLGTTQNAVVCAWKKTMKNLGISDLRWHDLRHEAASRLFEKGLNPMEVASITGHKNLNMLRRYTHLAAENLAAKLG